MKPAYLLDACALIAYLADEDGAASVERRIEQALAGGIELKMHKLNLLEVYYGIYREAGKEAAAEMMTDVRKIGFQIVDIFSDALFFEAGRLKGTYKISLADSVFLAEAIIDNAAALTSDHHEFDIVEKSEGIRFEWIR
jgi:predicted nucleic acid-binding protein